MYKCFPLSESLPLCAGGIHVLYFVSPAMFVLTISYDIVGGACCSILSVERRSVDLFK